MKTEPNILLCMRATEPARIRSAVTKPCARCAVDCWVSPASLGAIAKHGPDFEIVCIECGVPGVRGQMQAGKLEMKLPSEGQLAEMREHLSDADAQSLYRLGLNFIQSGGKRP